MDVRTRRIVGWVIVAVGVVIAIVGGLADQLGLGGEGEDKFGGKQIAALVAGLVVVAIGLAVALWPARRAEPLTDAETQVPPARPTT